MKDRLVQPEDQRGTGVDPNAAWAGVKDRFVQPEDQRVWEWTLTLHSNKQATHNIYSRVAGQYFQSIRDLRKLHVRNGRHRYD